MEEFVGKFSGIVAKYEEDKLKIKDSDWDFIYIDARDLDKFRGYINRLVNGINTKKFLEQSNGAEEAPEDIYGSNGISDSVE